MPFCLCNKKYINDLKRSQKIDKMLHDEKRRLRSEIKILLLGTGESGKSTVMKQMKIIHGENLYNGQSLDEIKHVIYQNILKGIKVLIDARDKLEITWGNSEKVTNAVSLISRADTKNRITPEYFGRYVSLIESVWNDVGIRNTYQRRNLFQLVSPIYGFSVFVLYR